MIRRVVALIGTASPSPTPATAVLMPTTRPVASASAPPELPGLSAASVWMTSSITRPARPARVGSDRPSALTTPAVTEPASPSGLPTATTSWPTRSVSASPSSAGGGVRAARPDDGQVGQRVGADHVERRISVPSANAAAPVRRRPTTCALVSRKPSSVNTTPDPAPRPEPPGWRRAASPPRRRW